MQSIFMPSKMKTTYKSQFFASFCNKYHVLQDKHIPMVTVKQVELVYSTKQPETWIFNFRFSCLVSHISYHVLSHANMIGSGSLTELALDWPRLVSQTTLAATAMNMMKSYFQWVVAMLMGQCIIQSTNQTLLVKTNSLSSGIYHVDIAIT